MLLRLRVELGVPCRLLVVLLLRPLLLILRVLRVRPIGGRVAAIPGRLCVALLLPVLLLLLLRIRRPLLLPLLLGPLPMWLLLLLLLMLFRGIWWRRRMCRWCRVWLGHWRGAVVWQRRRRGAIVLLRIGRCCLLGLRPLLWRLRLLPCSVRRRGLLQTGTGTVCRAIRQWRPTMRRCCKWLLLWWMPVLSRRQRLWCRW